MRGFRECVHISPSDKCMALFFEVFMPSAALFMYNLSCGELPIMNLPILMFFFIVICAPQLFDMDDPTYLVFRVTLRQLILSAFVLLFQFMWGATDLQRVPMPYMLSYYLVALLCAKHNSLIALGITEAANVLYLSTQYQNNQFILVSYALVSITAIFSPVSQRPRISIAGDRQSVTPDLLGQQILGHNYFLMLTTVIFVMLLSTENFKNAWVAIYQISHFAFCTDQRYKIHNNTYFRTFILWGESMNMYPTFSWKGITAKFCYSLLSLLLLKNNNAYVFVSNKYHRKKYVDVVEWEIRINNNLLIKTSKFFSKYVHNELSQYGTMCGTIDEKYIFTTKIYLLMQEVLRNLGVQDVIKRINLMYLMYVQKMKWQMLRYGQHHVFDLKYLKSIIKQ